MKSKSNRRGCFSTSTSSTWSGLHHSQMPTKIINKNKSSNLDHQKKIPIQLFNQVSKVNLLRKAKSTGITKMAPSPQWVIKAVYFPMVQYQIIIVLDLRIRMKLTSESNCWRTTQGGLMPQLPWWCNRSMQKAIPALYQNKCSINVEGLLAQSQSMKWDRFLRHVNNVLIHSSDLFRVHQECLELLDWEKQIKAHTDILWMIYNYHKRISSLKLS